MVLGYPGNTNRFKTSFGIEFTMNVTNPIVIKVREEKQRIMKDFMRTSQKSKIMYSAKFAQSSNYYKYSIGQNKGLESLNVIEKKKQLEDQFTQWANSDTQRKAKYGEAAVILAAAKYLPLVEELRRVLVVQAAMPAAMTPIMLARMCGGRVSIAVQVVVATTVGSLLSLPWIVFWGIQWIGLKPLLP